EICSFKLIAEPHTSCVTYVGSTTGDGEKTIRFGFRENETDELPDMRQMNFAIRHALAQAHQGTDAAAVDELDLAKINDKRLRPMGNSRPAVFGQDVCVLDRQPWPRWPKFCTGRGAVGLDITHRKTHRNANH
ncbi:MAG: hypothetical protein AAGB15_07275, partial [Pseudomonadota bacterium]